MPMLFGKVVVGPDCGNVGPLLHQWNYPVFSIDDIGNLGAIVRRALQMEINGAGAKNRPCQLDNYSTAVIADKLFAAYMDIVAL